MREIEDACKCKFTAIVNNSNLGNETTAEDVLKSVDYANEVSHITGLPIKCTCVYGEIYESIKNQIPNAFALDLQSKIN
jgi:hypothetical protein